MVTPSGHASRKWKKRTPDGSIDILDAWGLGVPTDYVTPYFTNDEGEEADEVRLYNGVTNDGAEYEMLLLRCDDVIVTSYPYDGATDERVEEFIDEMSEATKYYE